MSRILHFLARPSPHTWFGVITLVALLKRIGLYLLYRPVAYSDTGSYRRLAEAVANGWARYDGTRVPAYPAFLALFGSDERVYAAQLVLGLLTTLLFFYIGWRLSGRGWFGALAALAHTLNAQQVLFEANLLTETLATFFIALVLAGMAWLLAGSERPLWQVFPAALGVGLSGALAALTRPLFIFLPFWAALALLVLWRARLRVRWGAALSAGLSGLLLLVVWVNFIHAHYNRWGLTTMTGYHLIQHTGLFFEYVPDDHAAIRDTYLEYRALRIAETGSAGNAIWDAIPALQKASGLGFYDLSDELARISIRLILEHPLLYLKNVIEGWLWFWKAPVYWSAQALRPAWLAEPMRGVILAGRGLLAVANLAFVGFSLTLVWKKARRALRMDAFLWFALTSIWLTSIAQTLLDHGDNPRFLVPLQTLVVILVLWWGTQIVHLLRNKNETSPA